MNDGNDIQIELGQSTPRHIEARKSPLHDSALCAVSYERPEDDQMPVFVSESAMRAVEQHAGSDKTREVGGVLLGDFYRNDGGSFVEVTEIIEAHQAKGTGSSLTFTHETWEQINEDMSRRGDEKRIVGWYHSHPGLGVFMSRDDEFIHSGYFGDPWNVAMVVDPLRHSWGCFKYEDGELVRTGGFYVFGPKKAAKRVREYARAVSTAEKVAAYPGVAGEKAFPSAPTAISAIALLIAVVALAVAILSSVGSRGNAGGKQATESATEHYQEAKKALEISDLMGATSHLLAVVREQPTSEHAYRDLERIELVLSSPEVKALDSDYLDLVNARLALADHTAEQPPPRGKASWLPSEDQSSGKKIEAPAPEPVAIALARYVKAESTREVRLKRAEMICRLMETETEPRYRGNPDLWWNKAAKWIREEECREVAYGLLSATSDERAEWIARRDRLSAAERARVKRIMDRVKDKAK